MRGNKKVDIDGVQRAQAILKASNIEESITGVDPFYLDQLGISVIREFELPTNLRLGHLVEQVVGALLSQSRHYEVVYQGIQVVEQKLTLGELDYVIRDVAADRLIHLELAYKFYLYDPSLGPALVDRWIGPNRNDSLVDKLRKLRDRQFPLLYHNGVSGQLPGLDIDVVEQRLCLLGSLYIPHGMVPKDVADYSHIIRGTYLDLGEFLRLHVKTKVYYVPPKHLWGLSPQDCQDWMEIGDVSSDIKGALQQHRSVLCWQRDGGVYTQFFIVWW